MGRDLVELFGEAPLRVPEIEGLLHSQPETGAVAAELAEADRHLAEGHARGKLVLTV